MTDLEKHVNQPGRAKLVKKVREKINELGITYIYLSTCVLLLVFLSRAAVKTPSPRRSRSSRRIL